MVHSFMFLFVFFLAQHACASLSQSSSHFLCSVPFRGKPFDENRYFSGSFLKSIPGPTLKKVFQDLIDVTGKCHHYSKRSLPDKKFEIFLVSKRGDYSVLHYKVDSLGKIESLKVTEVSLPSVIIRNWAELVRYASAIDRSLSVSIWTNNRKLESYRGDLIHPIASAFKLYVLGELVDQVRNREKAWSSLFPIRNDWKSLPSAEMGSWADGKITTLYEFARLMIQESDNTATDHLIKILGQKNIENQFLKMGNDAVLKNQPLLTTANLFKLKWAAPKETIKSYVVANVFERRRIIENVVEKLTLDQVGGNGVPLDFPAYVDQLEWFGSTNSLCAAVSALRQKDSPEALRILSQAPSFLSSKEKKAWEYIGYKGGREPGVYSGVYLLKSRFQSWGCIAVAAHHRNSNVNEFRLWDFVKKALHLVQSRPPSGAKFFID